MKLAKRFVTVLLIALLLGAFSLPAYAVSFDKVVYANADPLLYKIEVDVTNQIITVFMRDENNQYTDIAKQFICTTGKDETPTPTGSFSLNEMRRRFGYFSEFDCYAQYWVNVAGGIYFHSVLYSRPKEGYYTRSSYDQLGKQGSHGCIRMLVEDVRWMYYNCPAGTKGNIVRNEPNEELRKSLLPKVSKSKYAPKADEYEAVSREVPHALLKRDAAFKSVSNETVTLSKGTKVTVLSSGTVNCRVSVNGVIGHIDTPNLSFVPNSPLMRIEVYMVISEKAHLYKKASQSADVIATYGKGTQLDQIAQTKSFYKVSVDGKTGFILKSDVEFCEVMHRDGKPPVVIDLTDTDADITEEKVIITETTNDDDVQTIGEAE